MTGVNPSLTARAFPVKPPSKSKILINVRMPPLSKNSAANSSSPTSFWKWKRASLRGRMSSASGISGIDSVNDLRQVDLREATTMRASVVGDAHSLGQECMSVFTIQNV